MYFTISVSISPIHHYNMLTDLRSVCIKNRSLIHRFHQYKMLSSKHEQVEQYVQKNRFTSLHLNQIDQYSDFSNSKHEKEV